MIERCLTAIHARGLLVVAVAAAIEVFALSQARADAEYFAPASPSSQDRGYSAEWHPESERSCEDAMIAFGDQSCGSMTGGPSGGDSNRN